MRVKTCIMKDQGWGGGGATRGRLHTTDAARACAQAIANTNTRADANEALNTNANTDASAEHNDDTLSLELTARRQFRPHPRDDTR
eukprot:gene12741-11124_t